MDGSFKLKLIAAELELGAAAGDKQPFLATVTYAGVPSDGRVGGTENIPGGPYRVFIPVAAMEDRVGELVGKSIFAELNLASHDSTSAIGQFTDAYMERIPFSPKSSQCAREGSSISRVTRNSSPK